MITPKQVFTEENVTQVTVGFPGIPLSAQIPIRSSMFEPIARWFRRTPPEQLVQVMWSSSVVTATEDDAGSVDVCLGLVNLSDRRVRIEALHLEFFYIAGYTTGVAQPLFAPPKEPVPPLTGTEVHFTINIASKQIRDLLQRIQKAQNPFSTPWLELTVGGKIDLHIAGSFGALQRARTIRLPFERKIHNLQLQMSCPSARAVSHP